MIDILIYKWMGCKLCSEKNCVVFCVKNMDVNFLRNNFKWIILNKVWLMLRKVK